MPYIRSAFRKYRNIESVPSIIPDIVIIFIHANSSGDNLISMIIDSGCSFENEVEPKNFQISLTGLEYSPNLGERIPGPS